ncbi:MAG: serine/threonine protein kinase [Deltaproteobacteria bacterium]|nr:serine/threonine protein kinase [Deltaproteobacteria bacterium]
MGGADVPGDDDDGEATLPPHPTTIDSLLREAARTPDDGVARVPQTIGRYRVDAKLGAGGMGVVYAGHDPALDRPVAIKLLRPRAVPRPEHDARLQREAQALARIDHPNVVSIYDVVVHDGHVHLVMEHVRGATIDRVIAARPHAPAEILALFAAAGRGLAATHAAGLVHRDFKPANVLVDERGLVQVGDFGLAFATCADADDDDDGVASVVSTRLTQPGALAGTVAYMAPEQLAGEAVGPAADQFAFCVALWEALAGQRPYAGESIDALRAAIAAGAITGCAGLSPRIERALRRGLAAEPAARFPSMELLLAALAPLRPIARPRWRLTWKRKPSRF